MAHLLICHSVSYYAALSRRPYYLLHPVRLSVCLAYNFSKHGSEFSESEHGSALR